MCISHRFDIPIHLCWKYRSIFLALLDIYFLFHPQGLQDIDSGSKPGVANLYSLIYHLANFKSKIYPPNFFIFSLLQMPIVIGKSVNFLLTKFTPKAGQIYLQREIQPRLKTPALSIYRCLELLRSLNIVLKSLVYSFNELTSCWYPPCRENHCEVLQGHYNSVIGRFARLNGCKELLNL